LTPRRSRRSGASPAELEAIERRFEREERAVGEAAASGEAWRLHQARARLRRDSDLLKRWRETRDRAPVKLLVRVLRIGEVANRFVPGRVRSRRSAPPSRRISV
jgi:hypothetical protein